MTRDIYQEVTDRIVAALETGTTPWLRPWRDGKSGSAIEPYNAVSGRPYNGINLLILGSMPYSSLGWLTFKQALELGGNVRKGERGTLVVFWKFDEYKKRGNDGSETLKTSVMARGYTVFNVEQCENLNLSKIKAPTMPTIGETDMNALATRVGAIVRHGGDRAYYNAHQDFVQMPGLEAFKDTQNYQSTLAHELTHWTGHEKRCAREFGNRFGDRAYAFEELVAEIGSAFLCAKSGIELEGLQHPNYLANWLSVLKSDKRAIFTASSKAREAASFLMADRADEIEERIAA